ncbi:hypothetical protein NPIL_33401 [Nephila pilipes]|uniref:Uncharacterized protein n=1 Tax=Nephila pilipes TaxID=299642 RepID=A0A8X6QYZ9_NEPPI|nr:hypothetical protein NPIL_33401 [Nephila pilipes]
MRFRILLVLVVLGLDLVPYPPSPPAAAAAAAASPPGPCCRSLLTWPSVVGSLLFLVLAVLLISSRVLLLQRLLLHSPGQMRSISSWALLTGCCPGPCYITIPYLPPPAAAAAVAPPGPDGPYHSWSLYGR